MMKHAKDKLRRSIVMLLCAAVLAGAPLREAHAIPLLDQALKILAIPLTLLMGASGRLEGVLMVVNTKLPIMLKTLELKQREKLKVASDENKRIIALKKQNAKTMLDNPNDVTQNACTVMTGGQDLETVQVSVFKQADTVINDVGALRARGSVLGTRYATGRPTELNPIKDAARENRNTVCRYGGPNDGPGWEKLCGKPKEDAKANPYRGANTTAVTMTNTGAFDEDKHFVAAMDFCVAMTGNLPLPYAQGRALTENIDNIAQFNSAMSNYAAQEMAAYNCLFQVARKTPLDGKYVKSDPEFKRLSDVFDTAVNSAAGDGGTVATRNTANLDKRGRGFLLDGNAGGYTEIDPKAKVVGELSADGEKHLIKGQAISLEQFQEAEYVYKWYSAQYISKLKPGLTIDSFNIYGTRLYNVQLMWHQYEQLERDVMMEAIQLARLTRQAQRNPIAGTPSN